MNGLLMLSLGLMGLVVWAISINFTLGYSSFETNIVRYCQAILILPLISVAVWMVIHIAGILYSTILLWLDIGPATSAEAAIIVVLALLICLPLFVVSIFLYHFVLSKIDRYLVR